MESYKTIEQNMTLQFLTEEQKFNQPLQNKDVLKQLEALNQMKKLIQSGAVPLCEKFVKPLVCQVFLDALSHRMVKIQAYKLINLLCRYYNIVEILRMQDEPRIALDLLDVILSDSQSPIDNVMVYNAYQLIGSNLLSHIEKIEFLKQSEQEIVGLLSVRELDINSIGAQQKPKNYVNPGAKSNKVQDKMA